MYIHIYVSEFCWESRLSRESRNLAALAAYRNFQKLKIYTIVNLIFLILQWYIYQYIDYISNFHLHIE